MHLPHGVGNILRIQSAREDNRTLRLLRHAGGQGPIDNPTGAPKFPGGMRIKEEARRGIGQGGNGGVLIGDRAGFDIKIPSPTRADFRRLTPVKLESMEESTALQFLQERFIRVNHHGDASDFLRQARDPSGHVSQRNVTF